jgi:hypothetical protein
MREVGGWRLTERNKTRTIVVDLFVCRLGHFACGQRDFSSKKPQAADQAGQAIVG